MANLMLHIYFIHSNFGEKILVISNRMKLIDSFIISLPWDQTTPLGYFGEISLSILNQQVFWTVSSQVFLLFIYLCANNFVLSEMFVSFIEEFDQLDRMKDKCKFIRRFVDFHDDVKR